MTQAHDKRTDNEQERLVRKSEQLSNFGTLTSLVSTAAYFIETTFVKKLPKWLSVATLTSVGVGIVSVVGSYIYKFKAGRMALDASRQKNEAVSENVPVHIEAGKLESNVKWVEKANEDRSPTTPDRQP